MSWKLGLKANALYRDGSKLSQPLVRAARSATTERPTTIIDATGRPPRARRSSPSASSSGSSSAQVRARRERLPQPAQGLYPEGDRRRPQGLSAHRRIRGRPARRDLHRHAQGRRRLPQPDEQLRHRDLDRPAIRRAARGVRRGLHLHALRAAGLVEGNDAIKMATSVLDYIFRELRDLLSRTQRSRPCRAGLTSGPTASAAAPVEGELAGRPAPRRPRRPPVAVNRIASVGYVRSNLYVLNGRTAGKCRDRRGRDRRRHPAHRTDRRPSRRFGAHRPGGRRRRRDRRSSSRLDFTARS